jgi:hypothetical protein
LDRERVVEPELLAQFVGPLAVVVLAEERRRRVHRQGVVEQEHGQHDPQEEEA